MNHAGTFRALDKVHEKKPRAFVAFVLNLFPGLGILLFRGKHDLKWLRFLGIGLMATVLLILPVVAVATHPYPLLNYHFSTLELLPAGTIALASGFLGACAEH
jgi:hypothetical protein